MTRKQQHLPAKPSRVKRAGQSGFFLRKAKSSCRRPPHLLDSTAALIPPAGHFFLAQQKVSFELRSVMSTTEKRKIKENKNITTQHSGQKQKIYEKNTWLATTTSSILQWQRILGCLSPAFYEFQAGLELSRTT